jgi:Activator of Hsp90 ATPase homolog 1-like protein.
MAKEFTHIFNSDISSVYSRLTSAILLDLNQKSNTFNTSYALPVGTEFLYTEESFGQNIQYKVIITDCEKPKHFAYTITKNNVKKSSTQIISLKFTEQEDKTMVSFSITLNTKNILQYFTDGKASENVRKKMSEYIDYTEKIIESLVK